MLRAVFLTLALALAGWSAAQHDHHADAAEPAGTTHHEAQEFDAGQLILGHIVDEHGWHVAGDFSIPLPVIIYDTQRGLSVFSSNRFEHGHAAYNGYMLHDGKIVAVDAGGQVDEAAAAHIWDFSITKNVFTVLLATILVILVFTSVAKTYARRQGMAPAGLQSLLEPVILFVRDDIAKGAIGPKKYERFMPLLLTTFFVILFMNLMGLIPFFPGGANATGNIAVTFTLSLIVLLVVTFNGNKHYWRHIFAMPGVPPWVLIILTPVEIMGMFLKPFVLMIRLFANITAGHIIVMSFFSLIFVFGATSPVAGYGVSVVSLLFTIFMFFLELLVAFIQAYVFTFLTALYIGGAVEESHEHKESLV
ncbi:MAG TPA: F0F1 ATP synthase subunit A [Flavobacteriales bacterium]|nr:F0F1 ATP synthase subunit A [Flavobacteriales bacterium]